MTTASKTQKVIILLGCLKAARSEAKEKTKLQRNQIAETTRRKIPPISMDTEPLSLSKRFAISTKSIIQKKEPKRR